MDNTPKYISVDTMPAGPGLEALAAEYIMGWTMPDNPANYPLIMNDPQGKPNNVPQYSRDLVLAMTLIEKWHGVFEIGRSGSGTWNVRLIDRELVALAYAQTLPLAICRAALKAVLPVPEIDYSPDDED